jgi:hypothetical protein
MVPLNDPAARRTLIWLWVIVLLAPTAWATALGVTFSLTNETCISRSRAAMAAAAVICIVLAILPAAIAWPWRQRVNADTESGERMRFMLAMAAGGSVLFALVNLLAAVPILFLDSCRT